MYINLKEADRGKQSFSKLTGSVSFLKIKNRSNPDPSKKLPVPGGS